MSAPAPVAIIGAAMDLGQSRRGVDMGPSAIRYGDLAGRIAALGRAVVDHGNVVSRQVETLAIRDERARYLPEILESCEVLAQLVGDSSQAGEFPLVLGGDHSLAIGVLGGLAQVHGAGAVIWFDAHADCNTPDTTPSGSVHGMPLAVALGWAGQDFASNSWPLPMLQEERTVLIGVRSLDEGEVARLRASRTTVFTMSEVDRMGMHACVQQAIEIVRGAPFVHLSFDMDVLEPEWAPGVGTPVRGGISYRESHLALELLAASGVIDSMEIVEVNPVLDRENTTGHLAVELVCSALGKRIL